MITLDSVVKSYSGQTILDSISLSIHKGEVTALVGPSGSGKSTLLRCINALEEFDSGQITVDDLMIHGGSILSSKLQMQLRQKVGMVFQQFHLFPHMTALENVMSGSRFTLKMPYDQAKPLALELLAQVGLKEKAESYPANLSGGATATCCHRQIVGG